MKSATPVHGIHDLNTFAYTKACYKLEDCSICLVPYSQGEVVKVLPCSHSYHAACIDPWLLAHYTCPVCNTQIIMPVATPVTAPLEATLHHEGNTAYATCRDCNRQYHRNPNVNPSTAAYFRCPTCTGPSLSDVIGGSCTIT